MRNQSGPAPGAALFQAARDGDEAAFLALVDAWLPALYDFAARLLGDEDAAAAVVQAAFAQALDALAVAPAGESPGLWLFALACPIALAAASPIAARALPASFDAARLQGALPARPPLATAVSAAAAALAPRHRALLDLHLRHDLNADVVGRVLGLSSPSAAILLERLEAVVEPRLEAALLVALGGPARCPGLRGLLGGQPLAALPPARRREAEQHAAACPTCTDRLQGLPAALTLFSALSPLPPPPGLANAVRATIRRRWPLRARPTGPITPAMGLVPPRPGPRPPSRVPRRFVEFGAGLAAAAGIVALALLAPASPLAVTRDRKSGAPAFPAAATTNHPASASGRLFLPEATATPATRTVAPTATAAAGAAAPTPLPTRPASSPAVTATAVQPSPTALPQPTPPATATPVPPAPTPAPSATATACASGLYTNTGEVTLPASGVSFFLVFNQSFCAPVDFAVQVTEGSGWLQAGSGGTIPSGGSARVDLVASVSTPGSYSGKVRVAGGGVTVTVSVAYRR
ncbi:MAG: hypothetical protein IT304_02620 [Dehalococcoidia bacterium]|nr:hypothetical protein [Dehalococcoidia bacterium]